MNDEIGHRVVVVGAGPAGLYAAKAAAAVDAIEGVDVLDALPTPYGLVRYGVAADHMKTKSVTRALEKILTHDKIRFFGNVNVGSDIVLEDLSARYDAVVLATGARRDRELGVPGEGLHGSLGAADFVSWYSGHPDGPVFTGLDTMRTASLIGAGNVALDVVRILARRVRELTPTDMPDAVIEEFGGNSLSDIHLFARKGPEATKFSPVELRELGDLAGVDVIVDPEDLETLPGDDQLSRQAAANCALLREWSRRARRPGPRRVHLHFWTRVTHVLGDAGTVERLRLVRSRPSELARDPGGHTYELSTDLLVRAIGYRSDPMLSFPFDHSAFVVPNRSGRAMGGDGCAADGVYVAGWLKRGPSGVIGTNREDAAETVRSLVEDLPTLSRDLDAGPLEDLLHQRRVRFVDWDGWKRVEKLEQENGVPRGAPSVKTPARDRMLHAALGATSAQPDRGQGNE